MKTIKCILGGGYNAQEWLGVKGLLSLESVKLENTLLSHRLSLQVDGSEDYKIPVQGLVIDFLS